MVNFAGAPDVKIDFVATAFFTAFLILAYFPAFALAALTLAHRFFVASAIAFLPAAESFRLGLGAALWDEG